jgi:hypothetical protein
MLKVLLKIQKDWMDGSIASTSNPLFVQVLKKSLLLFRQRLRPAHRRAAGRAEITCLAAAMASRSCRLDGPRPTWGHPRPRGSAFGVLPGEVLAKGRGQRIISARTPVPYPRMKIGSLPDARLMASNSGQARRGSHKRPDPSRETAGRERPRRNGVRHDQLTNAALAA